MSDNNPTITVSSLSITPERATLKRLNKGFTAEERAALVSLPEPYGFTLRFLLGTGLRWAEATRAQAAHVRDGVLEVEKTKSGKVRRIPLAASLAAEVRSRVSILVPFVHPGQFARTVKRQTGIRGFHVHRTRHDYAIQWLAGDGSLAILQELMGHAHISTTMRYARITQDLVQRESERVFRGRERA